ncbi:endoglucanase [Pseudomonas saudiphocaensis]|nr:endoglucanase [Pseudomonas saudiphocaensis]
MVLSHLFKVLLLGVSLVSSFVYAAPGALCTVDWEQYRQRFMAPDGRIKDTGNGDISHSEGQGWGMLFAVSSGDRESFDSLWSWTETTLRRQDVALFAWRYDPAGSPPIADLNDASDGDVLIAWALLRAAQRWGDAGLLQKADEIRSAITQRLVRRIQGYTTLLAGIEGFDQPAGTVINLSYLVIPAFVEFDRYEPRGPWRELLNDAPRLLRLARFGSYQLPPDWLLLPDRGRPYPASGWPARFSFDAVRIPLYYRWGGLDKGEPELLRPFDRFWRSGGTQRPPAWIDLDSGEVAPYPISTGVAAIHAYLTGASAPASPVAMEDYYSASLYLLTQLARGGCGANH